MGDPKSIAGEVEGDYSVVKVQLAAAPAGDKVARPTKGTQVVWGGSDPSTPWGHIAALIEKAGGAVTYTFIHGADLKTPAAPEVTDEGDAAAGGDQQQAQPAAPAAEEPKKDDKPGAPVISTGGIEGQGELFENGLPFTFANNPARVWAHPHCFMSGPRPLIILLHGINQKEALDHPLLNEKGHHEGHIAGALIDAGKATPLCIAAPTQKVNKVWMKFDFEKFIDEVTTQLKALKVEVDPEQISIVGHSAAGGYAGGGMNLVAEKNATFNGHKLKVLGLADTWSSEDAGSSIAKGLKGNDSTIVYSIFRKTGGWMLKGDSWASFAAGLGVKTGAKHSDVEDDQDITNYADDGGKHISIQVNESKFLRHRPEWKAAGGEDDARSDFEKTNHWDMVPMWFTWALPRFYPALEADKHAGLQPHEQPPMPPEEKPAPVVTGGEWANVPPAAKPLDDLGVSPKAVESAAFAPASGLYWPVRNPKSHIGRVVSFVDTDNKKHGADKNSTNGRDFLANRPAGKAERFHAGIDVFGDFHDIIVACEAGVVVNAYPFYPPAPNTTVWCLLVQCDSGVVINYGEVHPDSLKKYGMKKGVRVQPGQPIAEVGRMLRDAMLHFETYPQGTAQNVQLYQKDKLKRLKEVFNPSAYLLAIATKGK